MLSPGVEARSRPQPRRLCGREKSWVREKTEPGGKLSGWEEEESL